MSMPAASVLTLSSTRAALAIHEPGVLVDGDER